MHCSAGEPARPVTGVVGHERRNMSVALPAWRPQVKGPRRAFATVRIAMLLFIRDAAVLVAGARAWATLQTRLLIDPDGNALCNPRGKQGHVIILEWVDHGAGEWLSASVIVAIQRGNSAAELVAGGPS